PTIKIRKGNKLNVCYSSNTLEFVSTKATISFRISAVLYIEIEELQKLLNNRKDDIDDLLKLQHVYAIGIDFQTTLSDNNSDGNRGGNNNRDGNDNSNGNSNENSNGNNNSDISSEGRVRAAKISPPNLEYEIDVYLCKIGKFLSSQLLRMRGCGYYLDSVEVCVSPISCIPNNTNGLFISKDTPYPQQLNRTVEFSDGRKTNIEGQFIGEIGSVPKSQCRQKVVTYYVPECHSAKWHIKKNMSGFRITITQVLRYKIINSFKLFLSKPKLIKCPVITHVLEISFNKLEDFNANFAKLVRPDEEPYYNENDVNIEISNIQKLDGEIIIN
ncbi:7153_t:CDS:2, partial [Funneliformis caledonium]